MSAPAAGDAPDLRGSGYDRAIVLAAPMEAALVVAVVALLRALEWSMMPSPPTDSVAAAVITTFFLVLAVVLATALVLARQVWRFATRVSGAHGPLPRGLRLVTTLVVLGSIAAAIAALNWLQPVLPTILR